MDYLPFFFDLRGRECLVVGGGTIATRKARLLERAQAKIVVVAPEIAEEMTALVVASGGREHRQEYEEVLLDNKTLVIAATDSEAVNRKVSEDCQRRGMPVNVVDSPALCTIITPAIVDRHPLLIGISSGGESPVLARRIRTQLERDLPGNLGALGALASEFRDMVKSKFTDEDARRRFWERVLEGAVSEFALAGNLHAAREALEQVLAEPETEESGEVYLVGAGPGDPDLLTFKALRLMQRAEVVLYDRLVSPEVLDKVRRDAERVYVGKKRSEHTLPQTEINRLLLHYAQQGKRTLRLKGGDPFIFGRGGEEIDLLAEHGIPFQVVPGITAASGCSAYAGIPLTHRDHAHSVRFLTGYTKSGAAEYPWTELVNPQQTLVFYMGLMGLREICKHLVAHGKMASTPAALVERGTLSDQRVHIATIETIADDIEAKEVHAPTLLIIGDVVSLHKKLHWFKPFADGADIHN